MACELAAGAPTGYSPFLSTSAASHSLVRAWELIVVSSVLTFPKVQVIAGGSLRNYSSKECTGLEMLHLRFP